MQEKQHVNYVYFGLFFLFISFLHVYQIFLIDQVSFFHRCFYVVYALGQCLLETGILIVVGNYLKRRFSRAMNRLFIVLMFLLLLVHLVDFPLIRIMDMTVWYAIDFVFAESFSNFIEMLRASNISLTSWIMAGVIALLVPVIGIGFFYLADKVSKKKPVFLSNAAASFSLLSIGLFIALFDFKTYELAHAYEGKFLKALPWKTTLFSIPHPYLRLEKTLAPKPTEDHYLAQLNKLELFVAKKPNIFLFVIESLRDDFLTAEVAPHLAHFREECGEFQNAISAANATQISWFSIYHSVYPFYWGNRQQWQNGSLPLQILKKIGYKIHLFSSARLEYYRMNEILFGKDHHLADTFNVFADESKEVYENDTACIDALLENLDSTEGNVFLVFLDSTHFDYSWLQEESLISAPGKIDYLSVACAEGIDGVKDRYRNAVHFIDGLMGRVFEKVSNESIVVVTGDHGEEFLEQGNIFHASNLSSMQTRVPIYCRLGTPMRQELASHIDIFPTILHRVIGKDLFASWFDGESLLRPRERNFVVSSRYNASRTPFEFLIHDGKHQLVARFNNQRDVSKAHALHLISLRDEHNMPVDIDATRVEHDFKPALEILFRSEE